MGERRQVAPTKHTAGPLYASDTLSQFCSDNSFLTFQTQDQISMKHSIDKKIYFASFIGGPIPTEILIFRGIRIRLSMRKDLKYYY